MTDKPQGRNRKLRSADLFALEADVAYFDARISLAGEHPDTAYQKAQKKTYETLGKVMSGDLETLRRKPKA